MGAGPVSSQWDPQPVEHLLYELAHESAVHEYRLQELHIRTEGTGSEGFPKSIASAPVPLCTLANGQQQSCNTL